MIETRSWRPHALKRGEWVGIHAAKGFPEDAQALCLTEPFRTALGNAQAAGLIRGRIPDALPRGAIVAVARFDHATKTQFVTGISAEERAFGNYGYDRWAWIFDAVEPVTPPIPASGALFLWEWSPPAGFLPGIATPAADAPAARSLWDGEG